jgi:hypothetical protein
MAKPSKFLKCNSFSLITGCNTKDEKTKEIRSKPKMARGQLSKLGTLLLPTSSDNARKRLRAFLNSSMDQSVESVFYQNVVILLLDLC